MKELGQLLQAVSYLGLSWAEAGQLIVIGDDVPIAAWGHFETEQRDVIMLHPKVLRWQPEVIAVILRHEMLHYAGYGDYYDLPNRDAVNLALDVAINFILLHSPRCAQAFEAFRRRVYARVPANSPVILAAGPNAVASPRWRELQARIWDSSQVPSPYYLYFKFRDQVQEDMVLGFGRCPVTRRSRRAGKKPHGNFRTRESAGNRPQVAGSLGRAAAVALKQLGCSHTNLPFSREFITAAGLDVQAAEALLRRIRTERMCQKAAAQVVERERLEMRRQVYTLRPSPATVALMAAGIIPDLLPFVWEQDRGMKGKSLAAYVDTSMSLSRFRPYEVRVVDILREYLPTRLFVFADTVTETSRDAFAAGEYPQGFGTSFEAVLRHFARQPEEAAVIFTDGLSDCSPGWGDRLRVAGKRIYVVYLVANDVPSELVSSPLDAFAVDRAILRAPR